MIKVLAFDYGASGGRGILGSFDGERLSLKEVHRFENIPVIVSGSLHWNILGLLYEMKQGVIKCMKSDDRDISSIGVDTWGVDFGLLDSKGELLGNPYHYRDARTVGMIEAVSEIIPRRELYEQTGIQFQKFNTLYQLYSIQQQNPAMLERAETMLLMPDLFNYFLTGEKRSERTIASTTQIYNPRTGNWAKNLLGKLGIPTNILTDIIEPGKKVGTLSADICEELGTGRIPVIAVAEHDTGSAVASVPAEGDKYAYLSSGTWSLLGVESPIPVINDMTFNMNYTNEIGMNNTVRLLKNVIGLWIYQECKRAWDKAGDVNSFDELETLAQLSEPFKCFIDPDNELFYSPGNMPEKVQKFCKRTNQTVPQSKGEIVRCILESLSLRYRSALEGLEEILGYKLPQIHVVGGGCKNKILSRFTANASGIRVVAGPVEATAAGNVICQLIASGEIANLAEARQLVKRSFETTEYLPEEQSSWDDAYSRFLKMEDCYV